MASFKASHPRSCPAAEPEVIRSAAIIECALAPEQVYVCTVEPCCTSECKACWVANDAEPWGEVPCHSGGQGGGNQLTAPLFLLSAQHDLPSPCSLSLWQGAQRPNLLAKQTQWICRARCHMHGQFTAGKAFVSVK